MSKEKFLVIMEVEKDYEGLDGTVKCYPIGSDKHSECMFLKPERIISTKRLRYGSPQAGDMFFSSDFKWEVYGGFSLPSAIRLILDPAPPKQEFRFEVGDRVRSQCGEGEVESVFYDQDYQYGIRINNTLRLYRDEELEPASSRTCPACGFTR